MKKEKAIELLQKQHGEIDSIKNQCEMSPKYLEWKEKTLAIIKVIFGDDSGYYLNFNAVKVVPKTKGLSMITGVSNEPDAYNRGLREYGSLLHGMITEIELREDVDMDRLKDATAIVQIICNHFHQAVKKLKKRYDNRPPFEINDEYDVQDLLHAFLKLHFDDVRAEEWTPSYAGCASRMDFLLKKEKIVIEVKKTRKNLGAKEVGAQLAIDIKRYQSHPDCDTLICFVYDPEGLVENPTGVENDLNQKEDNLKVITIITPK